MNVIDSSETIRRFYPLVFIFKHVNNQKIRFFILLMAAISWSANQIFFPLILKYVINSVSASISIHAEKIIGLVSGLVAVWVLTEVMIRMQGYMQVKVLSQFRNSVLSDIYRQVCSYKYPYFTQISVGELTGKISGISPSCERLVQIFIFNFIPVISTVLIGFIIAFNVSIFLAEAILLWFSIHVLLTMLHIKSGTSFSRLHADSQFILSGKISDTIINIFNVKLFSQEAHEEDYLAQFKNTESRMYKKSAFYYEKMKVYQSINAVFFMLVIMTVLLYGLLHNFVTPGDFALISMLSFNMVGFVWYLSFQMTIFMKEYSVLSASLSALHVGESENVFPGNIIITKGMITFKNVDFSHNINPILKNINLSIMPGEKIGIVGASGSGKSTFVNLIAGIYNSMRGVVIIDGHDISNFSAESLRKHISYIPQDCILFNRTLRDNIRYGRLNASDQEVEHAAKLAACHDFIRSLEQGYSTEVGASGVQLSGGQRQRILIARAILRDSLIYIFDEATSSLDVATEKFIHSNMKKVLSNRTMIMVSHRISVLEDADRIFVFDKGQVVESGTFRELLGNKGYFFNLLHPQSDYAALMYAV